jgi:hypothetical protein
MSVEFFVMYYAKYTADAGHFRGRNREINKIAKPLNDWRWDLRGGELSRTKFFGCKHWREGRR